MTRYDQRVAVITGASRGIGAGLVRAFLERGMRVAACARSEPDFPFDADATSDARLLYEQVDVTNYDQVCTFAELAERELGPVDLWVNNAGVLDPIGMTRQVDASAFRRQVDVNLVGVFHGCQAYLAQLHRDRRHGAIANIGSGASHSAYRGWGAYCATKAAVDQLTRVMACEEAAFGNRIFVLAPGIIETDMQTLIRAQREEDFPDVARFHALHQEGLLGAPESPADAVLRLAFDTSMSLEDPIFDIRDL